MSVLHIAAPLTAERKVIPTLNKTTILVRIRSASHVVYSV